MALERFVSACIISKVLSQKRDDISLFTHPNLLKSARRPHASQLFSNTRKQVGEQFFLSPEDHRILETISSVPLVLKFSESSILKPEIHNLCSQ